MQSTVRSAPPLFALGSVRRESLTDQTARAIREAILNGTYKLGQKLREGELENHLGVSSSVIREALHILQGEGIIVTKPYCGRSVFALKPEEGSELTLMRASLECYAAYLAAQKIRTAAAEKILAGASRFTMDTPGSYSEWVERELGFHRAVWEASGNEWLLHQLLQFSVPVFATRLLGYGDIDVVRLWQDSRSRETETNPQGHQTLARAIVSGAAREARRLMILHIVPEASQARSDLLFCPQEVEQ